MSSPLKVKVFKKSKDAPYPDHIIVDRSKTYERVHLYFDNGYLMKLTHIKKDPQIKMVWNEQEKMYRALRPNYFVIQNIVFEEDKENNLRKCTYLKGPENQNFFGFSVSPPWNQSSIDFSPYPNSLSGFFIEMDLNDRCKPNEYIKDWGDTEIKEVYANQERKRNPLKCIPQSKTKE